MRNGYHLLFGLLICALALSTATTATAGAPQLVSYQGLLSDSAGASLDITVDLTFTIYNDPSAGSVIWTETQAAVTVSAGLFNVLLGSVTPLVDTVFDDTTRYLGITVGGGPEMTPRTRLVSVGYAHRVSTVDGASGGSITSNLGIGTTTPGVRLHVGNVEDRDALRIGSRGDIFDWNFYQDVAGIGSLRLKDGNGNLRMTWVAGGSGAKVGIGTTSPEGALDIASTDGALIVPRMTTTQRNLLTAVNGMIIYNSTTNQFNFYENAVWVTK